MLAALMLLFVAVKPAAAQDDYGGDIDYQQFYDDLDPYGQWVSDPDYGYVWIPDAGDDFRPYSSNGYWAYTDYGNTWVSNYSWGWAPFHYGRWTYHNYYGWMWIPGNTWGPAWVSWRSGGGNYGWAPLGPGISINIALGGYSCPDYWWNFAPQQQIFNRNWNRYSYGPRNNNTYINQTTIINNTYVVNRNTYLGGPRRNDLRAAIGRDPRPLAINNVRGPQRAQVRGDRLNIYRPAVAEGRGGRMQPREFRQVDRPIRGNTPVNASGFGSQPVPINRNPASVGDRPNRPDRPGFDRGNQQSIRNPQTPPQPDRLDIGRDRFNQQPVETTPAARDWNSRPVPSRPDVQAPQPRRIEPQDRFPRGADQRQPQIQPERTQQQPQIQPQRGFDRPQRSFEPAQPQRSFEQPRPQMQPQRSFDRPQPRSFEQPRPQPQMQPQRSFEQARPQPQMQQPQRMEAPRPQMQPQMQQPQRMEARPAPQPGPGRDFGGQRGGGGRFGR
jgi:hypothetical protein